MAVDNKKEMLVESMPQSSNVHILVPQVLSTVLMVVVLLNSAQEVVLQDQTR